MQTQRFKKNCKGTKVQSRFVLYFTITKRLKNNDGFKQMKKYITYSLCMFFAMTIIMLGAVSNIKALTENNCKMPVYSPYAYEDNSHFGFT